MARHNLPPESTSFVGRARDLDALEASFASGARVVTIVGAPGTGKTRLALRFADRARPGLEHSGGSWFVELAHARSSDDVCAALALAIGAVSSDASDPVLRLGHALAARGATLVVLDNFEQVVGDATAAVASWARMAPDLRLLVTSRERLRIPLERVYELAPLPVPEPAGLDRDHAVASDAVKLLLERAPGFDFADAEAPLVAEVLAELDGLPLAIELAAARLPLLGLAELSTRMHERLDLLARGPRTADARQATLRGALDWSWELLSVAERAALASASTFAGGFGVDAFSEVCGEPNAIDLLHELSDKSLLVRAPHDEGRARFGIYGSIAAYAREKLGELGLAAEVCRRHARHYARLGRQHAAAIDRDDGASFAWISRELDNLLAAHERMAALPDREAGELAHELLLAADPVLAKRGPFALHRELLERALSAPSFELAPPAISARLLRAGAGALKNRGELAASVTQLTRARIAAGQAGDAVLAAEIAADMGFAEQAQGNLDRARSCYDAALSELDAVDDPRARGRALAGLGLLHHSQGKLDEAWTAYDDAMRWARRAGDRLTLAALEKDVGSLRLQQGRLEEAREHYARALALEQRLQNPTFVGIVEGNLGILEQERGQLEVARAHFERALENFRSAGARLFEGHLLGYLAGLRLEQKEIDAAAADYESAVAILREVGDRRLEGLFLAGLASAEAARGRLDACREALELAGALLGEVGDPGLLLALELHRAALDLARARAAAERGEAARSTEHRARALALRAELGSDELRRALLASSDDARFALRLLDAALASDAVVFDVRSSELRLPTGERIELSTRAPLRRIVAALVGRHLAAPGTALGPDELLAAGWPQEKIGAEAASNRLKVALSTLRKLGMRELIVHTGDGWSLDPAVFVVVSDEPPRSARF